MYKLIFFKKWEGKAVLLRELKCKHNHTNMELLCVVLCSETHFELIEIQISENFIFRYSLWSLICAYLPKAVAVLVSVSCFVRPLWLLSCMCLVSLLQGCFATHSCAGPVHPTFSPPHFRPTTEGCSTWGTVRFVRSSMESGNKYSKLFKGNFVCTHW